MLEEERFYLAIPPIPKARVRQARSGKLYTPPTTRRYEDEVRRSLHAQYEGAPWVGPVDVTLDLTTTSSVFSIRASDHASAVKADVDNLAKSLLDAAQGVLFVNDRQVQTLTVQKW